MAGINKNPDRDWIKQRLMMASFCFLMAFALLFLRMVYLQLIKGEEYRRLSQSNCVRLKSIKSSRGLIYDRNNNLLVDNRPSFDLKIVREDAGPVGPILERLADLINVPVEELKESMEKNGRVAVYRPILLKKGISRDQLAVLESHKFDLPGVVIDVEPTRHYIFPGTASHLLGYLGQINRDELASGKYPNVRSGDAIGRYGVEKQFETFLQGKRGGRQVEVDVSGRVIKVLKTVPPVSGNDLYLTIDLELQQAAEELLAGEDGSVVAIDPNNGNVLAMASTPGFNQNDFIGGISNKKWRALMDDPGRPMTNKAIQAEYPPASTYKLVTAIAALEEKLIDRNSTAYCNGYYKFGNRRYQCWNRHGHGEVNVVDSLEESCDVFYYQIGEKISVDTLADYARGCGLCQATGIALAHERRGLIPTAAWKKKRFREAWQGGETLSISIGQGFNLVTPLQMAVFTAAVANGGTLYRPHIVNNIQSDDGTVLKENEPEIVGNLPASKETLALVKKGLFKVVQGDRGTARRIRIKGVDIAGKTGTAQVFSRKKGEKFENEKLARKFQDHAWFVAYAPAENPQIAISVIVEHGAHGSTAAAPVAGKLIRQYLKVSETDKDAPK